jgi:predicted dehydrogenase
MIEGGELGEIRHFRARYLQDWGDDPSLDAWRFDAAAAGSGALGDLMAHVVDLARFLNGEPRAVHGFTHTFIAGREVDDAVEAAVQFENGSVGTLESTRFAHGRRNAFQWEINGTKGSLAFDMERLNELQVFRSEAGSAGVEAAPSRKTGAVLGRPSGERARGFRTVLVSETNHPFFEHWWPPGHIIGWGDTFVHELHHMLEAIANDTDVAPYGATFEDGYRAAEICDAIVRSGASGSREQITYRA